MSTQASHLAPPVRADLDLAPALRARRMLAERFLPHERLQAVIDYVDFLFYRPMQTRASGLVVSGRPGAGKSMLAKCLLKRYPQEQATDTQPISLPVLSIEMTGAREAKTLYNRMLANLGVPDAMGYVGADRERMVLKVCRAVRVRMLILDEIQDVLTSTARQQRIALDTIKYLMNELQIPIITLGTSAAPDAMQLDEHLNARFAYRSLPQWEADAFLTSFLSALESSLPLHQPSGLTSLETRKLLVKLSGGVLDKIVKTVCYAGAYAVETGEERITAALLQRAAVQPPAWAVLPDPVQVAA
ncbi:TniB family NTP-binding protein [Luteibacter sp. RCC_6_2]|uniref:TniB family NTP-binding protein n=1 Tax=Luteibacter sp. RCC_6_2 TaxID=3239223 RepID=UPI0035244AE9